MKAELYLLLNKFQQEWRKEHNINWDEVGQIPNLWDFLDWLKERFNNEL